MLVVFFFESVVTAALWCCTKDNVSRSYMLNVGKLSCLHPKFRLLARYILLVSGKKVFSDSLKHLKFNCDDDKTKSPEKFGAVSLNC